MLKNTKSRQTAAIATLIICIGFILLDIHLLISKDSTGYHILSGLSLIVFLILAIANLYMLNQLRKDNKKYDKE